MSWKDLLQSQDETIILPWLGGRTLSHGERSWKIEGNLPAEFGWYSFKLNGRKATVSEQADPNVDIFIDSHQGYLIGNRIILDDVRVDPDSKQIINCSREVFLLEPGLDRFVRVEVGRATENGPLIYKSLQFPLGPEEDVMNSFLDRKASVSDIKNVSPALDAAFRMETWRREETERRRAELERQRREEEERRQAEERRQQLIRRLGDGSVRRELARTDFAAAARAALAISGAEYLDHRPSYNRNEMVVRFRFQRRRFECVCNKDTLQIIDAGICLRGYDDYNEVEEVGDTYFTLESLPTVIGEAISRGVLHVFRHVD